MSASKEVKRIVLVFCLVLKVVVAEAQDDFDYRTESANATTYEMYQVGVHLGIINPDLYPFIKFQNDEQNVFQDLYSKYISINGSLPLNYQEWLVLNHFILSDTQKSLFERKISKRSTAEGKRQFMNIVKTGDILISGRGPLYLRSKRSSSSMSSFVGHAAIMTSEDSVLEMLGGSGWFGGISDNNQKLSKDKWFDEQHGSSVRIYRCPDSSVAFQAADWAYRNYYNPRGGSQKTIHVKYELFSNSGDIFSTDPSYCSKLVIQAYYFGSGSKKVIKDIDSMSLIMPVDIPSYFLEPYQLFTVGMF